MSRSALTTLVATLVFSTPVIAQNLPEILWSIPAHGQSVVSVAFAADGQRVASVADFPESTAKLWSAADGSLLASRSFAAGNLKQVALAPDGRQLSLGQIVGTYPPQGVNSFWEPAGDELGASTAGLYAAYSTDGALLATGGGGVGRYLDINRVNDNLRLQHLYHGAYVHDVAFAPDGALAASAGGDNAVKLWDVASGALVRTLSDHGDDVSTIAFSADGAFLASGTGGWDEPGESVIRIWRVSDGMLLRTLGGHGDWVTHLAFTPDGGTLVSSGREGVYPDVGASVRFWRVADGVLLHTWDVSALDLAMAPAGGALLYGTPAGDLVLARLPAGTSAVDDPSQAAGTLRLEASGPNPLSVAAGTVLSLNLPLAEAVRVTVHDMRGRRVATLAAGRLPAGRHALAWNGRDATGRAVASGIYLVRAAVGAQVLRRSVTVVR